MIDPRSAEFLSARPLEMRYDPTAPVPASPGRPGLTGIASRQNQRLRRAAILATIRKLIMSEGCDGVTVRRIAECSGHAVQTIYNLVGPRDTAITEAISEYSRYVGLTYFDPLDPEATADVVEHQIRSIEQNPEFCRKVCLMFFGESRSIYYSFRANQIKVLHGFLRRQQKLGVLRAEVDLQETAAQIMIYSGALCIEWADRDFPLEELRQRLYQGYYNILAGAIASSGEPLRLALTSRSSIMLN